MRTLVVIPARGGSKGIPHKNIKKLNGKPLIEYSIDVARSLTTDENICVSTDDDEIINLVEGYGLKIPFKRPTFLASDSAGTYEVLIHALDFYKGKNIFYDCLILLQPTSPFRTVKQVQEALELYNSVIDMVVSVKEASSNPYYSCFEENSDGFLKISKGDGKIGRRQDAPKVWEYNGAIYIINVESLRKKRFSEFERILKYSMDSYTSIDLDTPMDWDIAELYIKNK